MEELAKEERLRKKRERDNRLGIWSFDRERAYPEFDFIRTGELGIELANEYVEGLRRSWRDGRLQRIERLVEDVASGIITHLAGVKAKREEHERWQREWQHKENLRALTRAREQREERRRKFLEHFVEISTEADELRSFLTRLRERMPKSPPGELMRMLEWVEARLECLEDRLTGEGISVALQEQELFPEIDTLTTPEIEEE